MRIRVIGRNVVVPGRLSRRAGPRRAGATPMSFTSPPGGPVVLELRSADVIHSFWVPHLVGQDGHDPGAHQSAAHRGAQARPIWRGVRRILRPRACADGAGGGRACPARLAALAGGAAPARGAPRRRGGARARPCSWLRAAPPATASPGPRPTASPGPTSAMSASRRTLGAGILPNNRGTLIGLDRRQPVDQAGQSHAELRHAPGARHGGDRGVARDAQMTSETGFDHAPLRPLPDQGPRPDGEVEELERIWCAPKGWQYLTRGQQ